MERSDGTLARCRMWLGRHFQPSPTHSQRPWHVTVAPTAVRVSVILLAVAGRGGHVTYLDALWWHALGSTSPET